MTPPYCALEPFPIQADCDRFDQTGESAVDSALPPQGFYNKLKDAKGGQATPTGAIDVLQLRHSHCRCAVMHHKRVGSRVSVSPRADVA